MLRVFCTLCVQMIQNLGQAFNLALLISVPLATVHLKLLQHPVLLQTPPNFIVNCYVDGRPSRLS